jgi:hypothetical protein
VGDKQGTILVRQRCYSLGPGRSGTLDREGTPTMRRLRKHCCTARVDTAGIQPRLRRCSDLVIAIAHAQTKRQRCLGKQCMHGVRMPWQRPLDEVVPAEQGLFTPLVQL